MPFGLSLFRRPESPMEAECINIQSDKNHLVARETLFIFVIIDNGFTVWKSYFYFYLITNYIYTNEF